jgi:hypothetical protein
MILNPSRPEMQKKSANLRRIQDVRWNAINGGGRRPRTPGSPTSLGDARFGGAMSASSG